MKKALKVFGICSVAFAIFYVAITYSIARKAIKELEDDGNYDDYEDDFYDFDSEDLD